MKQQPFLAEFLGSMAFVFVCACALSMQMAEGRIDPLHVAIASSSTLAIFMILFTPASGGHLNPAITFANLVLKRIDGTRALLYMAAQCAGSIAAIALAKVTIPTEDLLRLHYGSLLIGRGITEAQAACTEAVLSFFIVLAYILATQSNGTRRYAGIFVGAMTLPALLIAGPITGGAFNPARHIGSAFFAGWLTGIWVYILGPVAGALAAALVCKFGLADETTPNALPAQVTATTQLPLQVAALAPAALLEASSTKSGSGRWTPPRF